MEREFDITVDWRGFELHPETPQGGIELSRLHFERTTPNLSDYLQKFAASFGVSDMRRTERMPNTRRALAVGEFARDQGRISEFSTLTMDAHWKEARDIEDSSVLRDLAAASGIDPSRAVAAASDPVYLKRVDDVRLEYKRVGVGGIPTFVFGDEVVEGCQPYQVLFEAAIRAGVRSR